jgi:3-deoxy-D-manno-octulosonic acid kinase
LEIRPLTAVIGNSQILYDAALFAKPPLELFDPRHLAENNLLTGAATGRGEAWFFRFREMELVLRHFRRGGAMEKILIDRYLGLRPEKARSWREWQFLLQLHRAGLPVPRPAAANVSSGRIFYRADLITEFIPGARSLADCLTSGPLPAEFWRRLGGTVALFHRHGAWHPDLNARNILLDNNGKVFLIDFDRGRFRPRGRWQEQNLKRLLRSLRKIKKNSLNFSFEETDWSILLQGYGSPQTDVAVAPGL